MCWKEAAVEIANQMLLRNLSGIIIVDFINMKEAENKDALLQYFREITADSYITTKVIDMTALGLIEVTRKKIAKPLLEQYQAAENKKPYGNTRSRN